MAEQLASLFGDLLSLSKISECGAQVSKSYYPQSYRTLHSVLRTKVADITLTKP